MAQKIKIIKIGQKFGRLTYLGKDKKKILNNKNFYYLYCKCKCGKKLYVRKQSLLSGNTKSCGCLHIDSVTKHGYGKHPLRQLWVNINKRCYYTNNPDYHRYGGRGIKVNKYWRKNHINGFDNFLKWALENGWKKGLDIDRRDNNKGYNPKNCRFISRKENERNRRNTIFIMYKGKKWKFIEFFEKFRNKKVSYGTARMRILRGWSSIDAVTVPIKSL